MPRTTNYPCLLDESLTLKIKDLKRFGLLEKNKAFKTSMRWTSVTGSVSEISIKVDNRKNLITLDYSFRGSAISYSIRVTKIQSNLGRGVIYYFICPNTQKLCRNLYLVGGYFLHRTATKNVMYSSQIKSKSERNIKKFFDNALKKDALLDELYSKNFKSYYNKKPTKRFLVIIKELKKLGIEI